MIAVRKTMHLCAAFAFAGSLFAADPFVGRWKLDLAKTTTTPQNPSAPRPKEVTLIAKEQGEYRQITVHGVNADGSPIKGGFTIPRNGGPGKVADDNEAYDGITMKLISPKVHDLIYTKGDKGVATRHVVLSQDGTTMTTTYKGASPEGTPITRVEVWRKLS
jgi:hypothetical protein